MTLIILLIATLMIAVLMAALGHKRREVNLAIKARGHRLMTIEKIVPVFCITTGWLVAVLTIGLLVLWTI